MLLETNPDTIWNILGCPKYSHKETKRLAFVSWFLTSLWTGISSERPLPPVEGQLAELAAPEWDGELECGVGGVQCFLSLERRCGLDSMPQGPPHSPASYQTWLKYHLEIDLCCFRDTYKKKNLSHLQMLLVFGPPAVLRIAFCKAYDICLILTDATQLSLGFCWWSKKPMASDCSTGTSFLPIIYHHNPPTFLFWVMIVP